MALSRRWLYLVLVWLFVAALIVTVPDRAEAWNIHCTYSQSDAKMCVSKYQTSSYTVGKGELSWGTFTSNSWIWVYYWNGSHWVDQGGSWCGGKQTCWAVKDIKASCINTIVYWNLQQYGSSKGPWTDWGYVC